MKDIMATMGGTAVISSLVLNGGHPLLIILGYAVGACAVCLIINYLLRKRANPIVTVTHD